MSSEFCFSYPVEYGGAILLFSLHMVMSLSKHITIIIMQYFAYCHVRMNDS